MCIVTGKCVHQMERLYNTLLKKLNKRGKKDLDIRDIECNGENERIGDNLDKTKSCQGKYTSGAP